MRLAMYIERPVTAAYNKAAPVGKARSASPWDSARIPMINPTVAPPIVRGKVTGMNTIDCQASGPWVTSAVLLFAARRVPRIIGTDAKMSAVPPAAARAAVERPDRADS